MVTLILQTLKDWPIGTILGVLLILFTLSIAVIILVALFMALDSWFVREQSGIGRIVGKEFIPAHSTLVWNAALKTALPINHPARWEITLKVGVKHGDIDVSEVFYNSVTEGASLRTTHVFGRITARLYIKEVFRV